MSLTPERSVLCIRINLLNITFNRYNVSRPTNSFTREKLSWQMFTEWKFPLFLIIIWGRELSSLYSKSLSLEIFRCQTKRKREVIFEDRIFPKEFWIDEYDKPLKEDGSRRNRGPTKDHPSFLSPICRYRVGSISSTLLEQRAESRSQEPKKGVRQWSENKDWGPTSHTTCWSHYEYT